MTCRHNPGDPNCSAWESTARGKGWVPSSQLPATPDADNYLIEKIQRVDGKHIVLQVKYPNCNKCAFEGLKTLVYLNVTEIAMANWRRIDPHFRQSTQTISKTEAPSPVARFPGTENGFQDAIMYLEQKTQNTFRNKPEPKTINVDSGGYSFLDK